MNKFYLYSKSNSLSSLKSSKAFCLLLLVLFFSIIPLVSFGQSLVDTRPGVEYPFTVPPGVTSITVEVWGAGGGGGKSDLDRDGGGGGGAYAAQTISVIPGTIYNYEVGVGGGEGLAGQRSRFRLGTATSLVRAVGGGTSITTNSNAGGIGGKGVNCTGTIRFDGGDGGRAGSFSDGNGTGGGGGGSATASANGAVGQPGGTTNGGAGGIGEGNGGRGANYGTYDDGVNGVIPGGGGGGDNDSGSNSSSGSGAHGQIRITWTEISLQPIPQKICEGQTGSFTVATSALSPSYSWEYSPNGSTGWTTTNGIANVSGNNTATFSLNAIIAYNGYYFRCTVTSGGNSTISNPVALIVNTLPSPIVGTTTQPNCTTATGSVVLSGLPAGSWDLTRTPGNITTTGSGTSTTISGVPSGTYTYSVIGLNNGLKGEYFNNTTLSGSPALTRTDATVDFTNWGTGSPDVLINANVFSVRWSGLIQPLYSETYTFSTRSDDGIRLWVNGTQIINNWTDHGTTTDTGTIALTAGVKYSIVLEYYENAGGAVSQLLWSSTSQALQIIPQSQLFIASCSSPDSANVVINTQPATPAAPTGTATQSFCSGSTVANLSATGTAIQWYASLSGGSALAQTTVLVNAAHYFASQTVNGCESTTRFDVTVTLNASPTIATITAPAALCSGDVLNSTVPIITANGTAVTSSSWQLETGLGTGIYANITMPYTVTFADHGKKISYHAVNVCGANNSNEVMIIVFALPSAPTIGPVTQPCNTTSGSVVLNNLPATATWNLYQIGNATPIVSGGTGTTYTVSVPGLAADTTYNFTVNNGTCTSLPSANVVIKAPITKIWNGGWSPSPPAIDDAIIFSGNYNSSTTLDTVVEGCSCEVNSGAAVVFTSGKTLKVSNEVKILSGTLTFDNTASLVQVNDNATNTGNIIYNRQTSTVRSSDYSYWSSPVANQTLNISLSYASGMFYSYDDFAVPEGWKKETAATSMQIGKGYIIRGPQTTSPPPPPGLLYDASFYGIPNNGTKTIAIGPSGTSNLLGNPYPSAIDADQFLNFNSGVIDGTLYFWTHNTGIQDRNLITGYNLDGTPKVGSGAYAYTTDDYASYNLIGGVGIDGFVKGGTIAPSDVINKKPSGKIAAGQAFFTTSIATGQNAIYNNSMRVPGGVLGLDNSQFFKMVSTKSKIATTIEKHRIWLNLSNDQGAFKQTLVGYIAGGTNGLDSRFDGESFDGNKFVDFYSVNQDRNLVIQGRALPFDDNDEVPLGYRTTINGEFTINIDQVDGVLTNQAVFIEDKLTNTVFDLKSGNYTFTTTAGTFNDRFVLKYSNKTLGVDTIEKEDGILAFYSNNYNTLNIQNQSVDTTVNSVSLFNIAGQNMGNWDVRDSEQTNIQIPIKKISSGIYIVKAKTTNGESSKKIMVN